MKISLKSSICINIDQCKPENSQNKWGDYRTMISQSKMLFQTLAEIHWKSNWKSQKYIIVFRNIYTLCKASGGMSENRLYRPTCSETLYWTVTTNIQCNLDCNHILGQSLNGNGITFDSTIITGFTNRPIIHH